MCFLLELALLGAAGLRVPAGLRALARRNDAALLATGLYALAAGVAISAVPLVCWTAAATDNAFLGHVLFTVGLVPLRLALAIGGVVLLLARGPEPWQSCPTASWRCSAAHSAAMAVLATIVIRGE